MLCTCYTFTFSWYWGKTHRIFFSYVATKVSKKMVNHTHCDTAISYLSIYIHTGLLTDFATFDEDSDGYLSHTELQKHLPPTSSELLLRLFDDNKDDALTTQEIMALRDMIIDSMASDAAHSEVGGSDVTETPEDELYKYLHS